MDLDWKIYLITWVVVTLASGAIIRFVFLEEENPFKTEPKMTYAKCAGLALFMVQMFNHNDDWGHVVVGLITVSIGFIGAKAFFKGGLTQSAIISGGNFVLMWYTILASEWLLQ